MPPWSREALVKKKNPLIAFRSAAVGACLRAVSKPKIWKTIDTAGDGCRERGAARTYILELAPEDGDIPDFKPGQYVFVAFPGRGLLSSPRPFTIASPPTERRFIRIIAKDTGEWSGSMKTLPLRSPAQIWGPFGRFSYLETPGTGRFVFLAGGIGATPFLSMIRYMADADRQARVLFLWGARTRDDMAEKDVLAAAAERLPGFRFVPVLSHDPRWTGECGRVDGEKIDRLVPAFFGSNPESFEWNSASYRICGPGCFGADLRRALLDRGVKRTAIHSQSFNL